ncbi:hypothetical protein IRB23SM22_15410 [Alkalibacterium sp. s-m-22]
MSDTAVIYMSNGKTYTISNSPGTIASQLDNNASESDLLRSFELVNGKKVFINPDHVVAVETSELSNMDTSSQDELTDEQDQDRKDANLKAVKEFKDDIDGNME